jgi:hypothetical protein
MTYTQQLHSRFYGIMSWEECDALFQYLHHHPDNWYIYDITQEVPTQILTTQECITTLTHIQDIIKELHQERYCGIVYSDDIHHPTMIKIFHPHNLGKSCGSSETPPLPQWIVSKSQPEYIALPKPEPQGFISKFFT